MSVSEPAPVRGPVEAAVEEFWRPGPLEDVVGAVGPWRAEDAGAADVSADEWDAFVRALAE